MLGGAPTQRSPDPGDVNTRVRNIYAKLQARDRFSAVRRVRELRLLAAGPGR
jgi:LuxR family maltose regulon positive regulatory protein